MKRCLFLLCCLLWASPVLAQVEIVAAVKNDLVARHVNLSGPCGAFEVTKRVAWALRAQGIGLLSKPGGNNCQGYSVDYLVRPDASGIDILGDSGGDNSPDWADREPPGALAGRWMAPFDPGDALSTPPPPIVNPPAPSLEQQILDELRAHEAADAAERDKAEAFRESVADKWKKFGVFLAKYAPAVIGAIFAGRATVK